MTKKSVKSKDNDVDEDRSSPPIPHENGTVSVEKWEQIENVFNKFSFAIACVVVAALAVILFDEWRTCQRTLATTAKCPASTAASSHAKNDRNRIYWIYGVSNRTSHLEHVEHVLNKMGYDKNANATDWDLLWAHDYPFRAIFGRINNLKSFQRVNHFPGSGYITNKADLSVSGLKYIPPAFKLPEQKDTLLAYVDRNPETIFVQKDNNHREIHLRNISDINLDVGGTFVQKFVDKPLLVSGFKFDVGIYTTITSIDPLRIYIYNGEALLRFCPKEYYPFDPSDLDKYVVGDDYLPTWEVPDLKYYYTQLGFGMKESLNAYIRDQGRDPSVIWVQIEDSIRIAVLAKESLITSVLEKFGRKRNFFEMMRFDFVIDENLNVFLMEANMSPNLSSSHYAPNKLLYEQVIYNMFSLVGVGNRIYREKKLPSVDRVIDRMQATEKNIVVFPEICNSDECKSQCSIMMCRLCLPCMSRETKHVLLESHREHLDRADNKRIFPPPMHVDMDLTQETQTLSANNKIMFSWFYGKCKMDPEWCN